MQEYYFKTKENSPFHLPDRSLLKYNKHIKEFPQRKLTQIANNSFSFSRRKLRIKRKYISISCMNININESRNKLPLTQTVKVKYIPESNQTMISAPKKVKIFPRATYNFLSNIQRFDYQKGTKSSADIDLKSNYTETNKPKANLTHYYHKKLTEYQNLKKQMSDSASIEPNAKKETAGIIEDNIVIVSGKGMKKRAMSENKSFGKLLRKLNREVFDVLPSREIVSVFVSKSQKGINSIKNHVPGPTYYNPKRVIRKSYFSNTDKIWI